LVCVYENLYYCCGGCNSRKNNDWPADESAGPYVVNPCDFEMASHLRFNGRTGEVESSSADGKHTIDLLQLNTSTLVAYRLSTLRNIRLYEEEIEKQIASLKPWKESHNAGKVSKADYDAVVLDVNQEVDLLRTDIQKISGELALPPLTKRKFNLVLVAP
jgi:hypothetical protein